MTLELYGAEQGALGKYLANIEQIRRWMKRRNTSPEAAAELFCVTKDQFYGVVKAIETHPDWDDEQIYEEVDWRRNR